MAGEYTYNFAYAAEYSDNIRRVSMAEEDELAHVLSTRFSLTQNSRELDARAQATAAYRDYRHDTFADDTSFGLNGAVVWKPLPDAFHWTVEDVYTQVAADPTAADTPANRVNANVFSTGPDVFWRLSGVQTLQLGGRYAVSSFDKTEDTAAATGGGSDESDNTRRSGTLRWLYRSSAVTTYSVAHSTESVEFDDPASANFDFRRYETTVGLINQIARNNVTLDLGETRIKRVNQPEIDGALARLLWIRQLTSDASFSLTASRSLSDTAEELLSAAGGTGPTTGTISVSSSDVFVSKQANALYSRRSGGNTFSISAFQSKRIFEQSVANDEDSKGMNVEFTRLFTETVSGLVAARYVETLFPSLPREDKTKTAGVGLQYRFNRTLSGGLAYTWQSRSSTDPGAEYVENRAVLSLGYNSLPSRW